MSFDQGEVDGAAQSGLCNWAPGVLTTSRRPVPSTRTMEMPPPFERWRLNTIDAPSGDHDGFSTPVPRREFDRDPVEVGAIGTHQVELPVRPLEHDPRSVGGPGVVTEGVTPRRDPDRIGAPVRGHHEQCARSRGAGPLRRIEEAQACAVRGVPRRRDRASGEPDEMAAVRGADRVDAVEFGVTVGAEPFERDPATIGRHVAAPEVEVRVPRRVQGPQAGAVRFDDRRTQGRAQVRPRRRS